MNAADGIRAGGAAAASAVAPHAAPAPEVLHVAEQVRAAGSRGVSCFRNPGCGHEHLDLRPLRRLRFYRPGDLTVGVDAGMTAGELNRILGEHGQWVPLDVPRPESMTLGAILATHAFGPLRQRFGTVRDFTIGLEMVSAQGRIVHSGGQVVKNVAGYDWMKLAIGGRGELGIITGINFRVFPRPRRFETVVFAPLTWEQVERLRSLLLHSPIHPLAVQLWVESGMAPEVAVRLSGSAAVLARCRAELEQMASETRSGQRIVPEAAEAEYWERVSRFPEPGDQRIALPPAEAAARLAVLGHSAAISGCLGLGVFFVRGADANARANALPSPVPTAITAKLMERLKRELDPEGVMHGERCGEIRARGDGAETGSAGDSHGR